MDNNFYFEFENKFRGSREEIIDRISIYDPLIELILNQSSKSKFVDIGCGRGEWLQKWNDKAKNSIGIDIDASMVDYCLQQGFTVIRDDAVKALSRLDNNSITVITIFHMIEHLDSKYIDKLIGECYRILDDDGLLIIETPSIDNIVVSTKLFYLDPTHINHINPDGFAFSLERKGFSSSKYFFINGGPLEDSSDMKITKILNGVAQDVSFIVTKSKKTSNLIFHKNIKWQKELNTSFSTIEAAISYDQINENLVTRFNERYHNATQAINASKLEIISLKNELNLLNNRLFLLNNQLKYVIYFDNVLKKTFRPFLRLYRYSLKKLINFMNRIFLFIVRFKIIRDILKSHECMNLFKSFLSIFIGNSATTLVIKIQSRLDKFINNDTKSDKYNVMLRAHYRNSKQSKIYFNLLNSSRFRHRK